MTTSNEKQAIEELARLLDGSLPADQAHASVRQLASLATAVKERVEVPAPTPEFKDALRDELIKGLGGGPTPPQDGPTPPQDGPGLLGRIRDAVWD
ncbi:MAG: hypothetical protein R3320_14965 [Nitriliruptorales bacterium]|nr:hypothetical protein [Nitriliruptorales bacterium]